MVRALLKIVSKMVGSCDVSRFDSVSTLRTRNYGMFHHSPAERSIGAELYHHSD